MLIFSNIGLIFLLQNSFSSMLVESDHNIIIAKMFRIQLSLKKVFGYLHFQSVVLHVCICYFILTFLIEDKIFLLVLRSKSVFCEHYFLPQAKIIGSIKRYFHTFPLQACFVFHVITFLNGFFVLNDLLKPTFAKK